MCPGSQKGPPYSGLLKHNVDNQLEGVIPPLYPTLVQPHLQHCMHFWALQYKKDVKF